MSLGKMICVRKEQSYLWILSEVMLLPSLSVTLLLSNLGKVK